MLSVLATQTADPGFREAFGEFAKAFSGYVWGTPLVIALTSMGIIFTIMTRGIQLKAISHGFNVIRGKYDDPDDEGNITHFQALMTALSATVGLGNISGVAVAVATGGPGAVFWMWCVGVLGMATKFMTCSLATMYREEDVSGTYRGGPMYYIEIGLGKNWKPLALLFALLGALASLGAGNMFQANQVAQIWSKLRPDGVDATTAQLTVGVILFALALIVIIGGIKRIGLFASRIVPSMIIVYMLAALWVILSNVGEVPAMLGSIFESAFTGTAATGGFIGVTVAQAIALGVKRACFSNEAGLGSAPIAHAAAKTDEPIREGVVAAVGPFLDTIVVCTITALVILITRSHVEPSFGTVESVEPRAAEVIGDDEIPAGVRAYLASDADLESLVGFEIAVQLPPDEREPLRTSVDDPSEHPLLKPAKSRIERLEDGRYFAFFPDKDLKEDESGAQLVAVGRPVYRAFEGIELTSFAFDKVLPGFGKWFLPIAAFFFAFSTIISWGFYGETCMRYLLGDRAVLPFKLIYVSMIVLGASFTTLKPVLDFSDAMLGLMLVPNLIGTFMLAPKVMRASREYFKRLSSGEFEEEAKRIAEKKRRLKEQSG